jgi:hypothetical protein
MTPLYKFGDLTNIKVRELKTRVMPWYGFIWTEISKLKSWESRRHYRGSLVNFTVFFSSTPDFSSKLDAFIGWANLKLDSHGWRVPWPCKVDS